MINYSVNFFFRKALNIKASIAIKIEPDKLWNIITAPGHLKNYHPFCEYHEKSEWNGVGCRDVSKSYYGKIIRREVIHWEEGKSYTIKMDNNDKHNTTVKFEIHKIVSGSLIEVSLTTNAYRNNPRPFYYPIVIFLIIPSYKKYFYSLLNGLKYFSETGNKVKRNQFGHHKKYSPKEFKSEK